MKDSSTSFITESTTNFAIGAMTPVFWPMADDTAYASYLKASHGVLYSVAAYASNVPGMIKYHENFT